RGLATGASAEQRGALLSALVGVYFGQGKQAEVVTLGTEALDLLPEGSKRWCRAAQQLFPAIGLTQQWALLEPLSVRLARVEPTADARAGYIKAVVWLTLVLGRMGKKDASRAFLRRAQEVGAALDRGDTATWGFLKGAESNDQSVIEEAPWSCMRTNAESR